MKITRKQLRRLIIKEARSMAIATEPGHPSPRTHETPTHKSGAFFATRRQPMGRGYGRIAKDYLFYVQMDAGESIRIPHKMHIPITSPKQAAKFVNYLDSSFRKIHGETVSLDGIDDIAYIIINSDFKNTIYY